MVPDWVRWGFRCSENDASLVVILLKVLSFYILTIEKVTSFEYFKLSKFTTTVNQLFDPKFNGIHVFISYRTFGDSPDNT